MAAEQTNLDVPLNSGAETPRLAEDPLMATQNTKQDVYEQGEKEPPRTTLSPLEEPPAAMDDEHIPSDSKQKGFRPTGAGQPDGFMYKFRGGVRSMWQTRVTENAHPSRDARKFVRTTLRELIVYIIFLIVICIITFGMTDRSMYYYTQVLKELLIDKEIGSGKDFKGINTPDHFWEYVGKDGPLLKALYWDKWYDSRNVTPLQERFIFYENKLLGLPRIRSLRVQQNGQACNKTREKLNQTLDHIKNIELRNKFLQKIIPFCYSPYGGEQENRTAFGLKNGTAWTYSTSSQLDGSSYSGLITSFPYKYWGGGFYLDVPPLLKDAEKEIATLKANRWTDRATRVVFVDFTVYNANINLFCAVKLVFEFPATGGVISTYSFQTVRLIRYVSNFDYFVLACEIIFCIFIAYYIIEEVIEIWKLRFRYFKNFWNLLDIIVILISLCCIGFSVYRSIEVENRLDRVLENDQQYANFEYLSGIETAFNDILAILIFFAWIKLFKYIGFNKTMSQLGTTLGRCAKDVAAFSVLFFLFFFAYVQLGYLVFGKQVEDYHTIYATVFTLLRTILGDFQYRQMEEANRILGPIFFVTYIMLIFFILLNMFLAIINDTYAEVKVDLNRQKNDFELGHYLKHKYRTMLAKLNLRKDQMKDIKEALASADLNKDRVVDYDEFRFALKRTGDRILDEEEQRQMKAELSGEQREIEQIQVESEHYKEEGPEVDQNSEKLCSLVDFRALAIRVEKLDNVIQDLFEKIDIVVIKVEELEEMKMRHRENIAKLVQKANRPDGSATEKLEAFHAGLKREMDRFALDNEYTPPDPDF